MQTHTVDVETKVSTLQEPFMYVEMVTTRDSSYAQFFGGSAKYKTDSKALRIKWFQSCLDKISEIANLQSVAFPYKIGCNLGGGDWETYALMIDKFAQKISPKEVFVIKEKPTFKLLVCGDRKYNDYETLKKILTTVVETMPKDQIIIINGDATGADTLSSSFAKDQDLKCKLFPAEWRKYGDKAGPIRNWKMIQEKPKQVIAFHNDIFNSKGTKGMIKISLSENIPTFLCENGTLKKIEKDFFPRKRGIQTSLDQHLEKKIKI